MVVHEINPLMDKPEISRDLFSKTFGKNFTLLDTLCKKIVTLKGYEYYSWKYIFDSKITCNIFIDNFMT